MDDNPFLQTGFRDYNRPSASSSSSTSSSSSSSSSAKPFVRFYAVEGDGDLAFDSSHSNGHG